MDGLRKLDISADAAKYDAARTSSGTELQDSRNKARPFIVLGDHRPQPHLLQSAGFAERFEPKPQQLGIVFLIRASSMRA